MSNTATSYSKFDSTSNRFRTAENPLEALNAINSTLRKIAYYLEDLVELADAANAEKNKAN